jgi:hypothetical protein
MGDVLRIDYDSDLVNRYAQAFRTKYVFQNFRSEYPQHNLFELVNNKATANEAYYFLLSNPIDYISAAGHGRYEAFIGENGVAIWNLNQSFTLLRGKILHILACETGAIFGRTFIKNGGVAFWGYTVNFVISHLDAPPLALADDKIAEIFLRMDAIIDRGILSGNNSRDIYNAIEDYVAYIAPKLTAFHRGLLISNFAHIACPVVEWGLASATMS